MSAVDGIRSVATVTVLVCDLVSSTTQRTSLGDDLADGLAATLDYYLRQSVLEHRGNVLKSTGDGLIATFDAASDALAAAVRAHQRIERRNRSHPALEWLVMRVGLSAGDVQFIAHDLHGTPVVEAARLEAAAEPGSILASALVRSLAGSRGSHHFEPVGTLMLKGLPQPVEAFRVVWEPLPEADDLDALPTGESAARRIPLPARLATPPAIGVIGYARALQTISEAMHRVAAGHGREVVLVMGEAGQGKTTVVAAAARAAFDDGACVLFGHCEEDLAPPYQLFVEALDHYITHASEDGLFAHVDAHGFELARLVPSLTERIPELRHTRAAEPETERFLVFAAATGLLAGASRQQPVMLAFDDLQWADKASLSLLTHIVAALPTERILVIGTVRDSELVNADDLRETLGGLQRHGGYDRVELLGLDRPEVVAYMEAGAGYALTGASEMALAAAVHRETDGNPFFVGQLLRHLVESGTLYLDHMGRWAVDGPVERVTLPDSVREVIGGRVVRLGRAAERVLALAAVIGRDFDLDLLTRASLVPADELIDMLDAAMAVALVREVPDQPGRFQFAHALIQHTLYDDLGPTRRQRAHRQVAEALEALCADDPTTRIGELARHWTNATHAGDRAKAIAFSRRAGDAALAALAPSEARYFYSNALDLLNQMPRPDPDLAIDLAIGLGTSQRQTGDPGFRDTLLAAARRAIELDDTARLVAAALAAHRGLFSNFGAIDDERVEIFEAALARIAGDDPNRALILATYCLEVVVGTTLERRQALADEALAIAQASGDEAVIVRVLNNLAYALMSPPMLERSLVRTTEALERATALGDPVLTFFAANWRRQACAQAGDIREMDRCTDIMAGLADRLKQPMLTWVHTFGLAWLAIIRGDTEAADRLANEAVVIGQESGQPDAEFIWGGQMVIIHHQRGVLDQLQPVIQSMVVETPSLTGVLTGALIAADIEAGRIADGRSRMAVLAAGGFELEMNPVWISGMAFYAEAAIELDEPSFAAPLFQQLEPWADQWSDNGATAANPISHFLGGLATVLDRFDDAAYYFQRSAAMCRAVGARFFLAETELLWARMLVRRAQDDDRRAASELLRRARDAGSAAGYGLIVRRADEALANLR